MNFPFQYKLQVTGQTYLEQTRDALFIFNYWNRFDSDVSSKARYDVVTNDSGVRMLKLVSGVFDQKKLSARYSVDHLTLTNYRFGLSMIPSAEPGMKPGIFGSMFWYLDDNHYYYIGWDGGQYGWGNQALRIYKFVNGVYTLVQGFDTGYYTANDTYEFDVILKDKTITATIRNRTKNTENTYYAEDLRGWGRGAYGPAGAGQPITFLSIRDFRFGTATLSKTFEDVLDETHRNLESSKQITTIGVANIFSPIIEEWEQANGSDFTPQSYDVISLRSGVFTYFEKINGKTNTIVGSDNVWAYVDLEAAYVPETPINMKGRAIDPYTIEWTWEDTSENEQGFIVGDENGNTLAVVGANVTVWIERNLQPNTSYTRKVRSYFKTNMSMWAEATATTPELPPEPPKPPAPINLDGEAKSYSTIEWTWDGDITLTYQLYDEYGRLRATIEPGHLSYLETGLSEDTLYHRYVIAINLETMKSSDPSNLASERTPKKPNPELPKDPDDETNPDIPPVQTPDTPIRLEGVGISNSEIRWSWEMPEDSQQTCFKLYDAVTGELIAHIIGGDIREYVEENLERNTRYYRYLVACDNDNQTESNPSNVADAMTRADVLPGDYTEEEEWWDPSQVVCAVKKREGNDYLKAFASGVGDLLDLKVKMDTDSTPKEQFTYELQVKGKKQVQLNVFPKRDFKFRFLARGILERLTNYGEYHLLLKAYPPEAYKLTGHAEVDVPEHTKYRFVLSANGSKNRQIPHWFTYTVGRDLLVERTYELDIQDFANASYPSGAWTVDGTELHSTSLTANQYTMLPAKSIHDYRVEASMKIDTPNKKNRPFGVLVRGKHNQKGNLTGYGLLFGRSSVQLVKYTDGPNVYTVLDEKALGYNYLRWYNISVTADYNKISYKIVQTSDNSLIAEGFYVDKDAYLHGALGIISHEQDGVVAKDILVTELHQDSVYVDERTTSIENENVSGWSSYKTLEDGYWQVELQAKQGELAIAYSNKYEDSAVAVKKRDERVICEDNHVEFQIDTEGNIQARTDIGTLQIRNHVYQFSTDWKSVDVYKTETPILIEDEISVANRIEASRKNIQEYYGLDGLEIVSTTFECSNPNFTFDKEVYGNAFHGTHYIGQATFEGVLYAWEGKKNIGNVSNFQFKNEDGDILESVNIPSFTPSFTLDGESVSYEVVDNRIYVQTNSVIEGNVEGMVYSGKNIYKSPFEILELDPTVNYHYEISKVNESSNVWVGWRYANKRDYIGSLLSQDTKDIIMIGAEYKIDLVPFERRTAWYDGSVNGKAPFEKDGDGQEAVRAPLEIELPNGAKDVVYGVELHQDTPSDVQAEFEISRGTETNYDYDVVLFTSDFRQDELIEEEWEGTVYNPGIIREIQKDETVSMYTECYSPLNELRQLGEDGIVTDFRALVRSHNPNVYVWIDEEEQNRIPWKRDSVFLGVKINARLLNHTQTAWHPLIHNGYYYLHEKEHYLFAESKVEEAYGEKETHHLTFNYMLEVMTRKQNEDFAKIIAHNEAQHFSGIYFNVEQANKKIALQRNASGIHHDSGYYVSQEITPGIDYVEQTWNDVKSIDAITWDANGLGLGDPAIQVSDVRIQMQSRDVDGQWTEWVQVGNGDLLSVESNTIRYRAELLSGKNRITDLTVMGDRNREDFLRGTFREDGNLMLTANGFITMRTSDITTDNKFTSRIFDLGENVDKVEVIKCRVYLPGDKKQPRIEVFTHAKNSELASDWREEMVEWTRANPLSVEEIGGGWYWLSFAPTSNPRRYMKYQIRFQEAGEETYSTVYHDANENQWQFGTGENILFEEDGLSINLPHSFATYISRPFYVGKREDRGRVLVDVTQTFDKKGVEVYTNSAPTAEELKNRLENNIGWSLVNSDGTSESLPFEWMAYKLVFTAGESDRFYKQEKHITREDFETGEFTNVSYDGTKNALVLQDDTKEGTFKSDIYTFENIKEWGMFEPVFDENSGSVEFQFETSDDRDNWTSTPLVTAPNALIGNDLKKFIRYTVRMRPSAPVVQQKVIDGRHLRLAEGDIHARTVLVNGTLQNDDNLQQGVYVSPAYELKGITSFDGFTHAVEKYENGSVELYTRTARSLALEDWSAWTPVLSDGTIQSPPRQYLQFKAVITPGVMHGIVDKKWDWYDQETFVANWKNGNPVSGLQLVVNETLSIPVTAVTNPDDWYYYDTDVVDLDAEVITFDNLQLLLSQIPAERHPDGDIKVMIATAQTDEELEGEGHGRWVELTQVNGSYPISLTEMARYVRIRIGLRVGLAQPKTESAPGEESIVYDLRTLIPGSVFHEFRYVSQSGDAVLEYQTASNPDMSDGVWTTDITELNRTLPYFRFRVKSGTAANVKIHTLRQMYVSPFVESISTGSQAGNHKVYAPTRLRNLGIRYEISKQQSPSVYEMKFGGYVTANASPVVRSVTLQANSLRTVFPLYAETDVNVARYHYETFTPSVWNFQIHATIKGKEEEKLYFQQQEYTIPHDFNWHRLTDLPLRVIAEDFFAAQSSDPTEVMVSHRVYPIISGVDLGVLNEEQNIDPNGYLWAKTNTLAEEKVFRQTRIHVREGKYAYIHAVPQQGAPVVVLDELGPMERVSFFDENGNPTLDFEEIVHAQGRREIALTWTNIDTETLIVEIDNTGRGDWEKVEKWALCENILYLPKIYRFGTPIRVKYRIVRSFCVDHNFKTSEDISRLELHRPHLSADMTVKIYAETSKNSAYYNAQEVNLNPLQQFSNNGFLYVAKELEKAVKVEIYLPADTLYANGRDYSTFLVRVTDINGNPVVQEELLLSSSELPSNAISVKHGFTDENGVLSSSLHLPFLSQEKTIYMTVYAATSNVRAVIPILVRPELSKPIMSLWTDATTFTKRDGSIVVYARLVDTQQKPISNVPIYFQSSAGTMAKSVARTNYLGIAKVTLLAPTTAQNAIIEVLAQSVDYDVNATMRLQYQP